MPYYYLTRQLSLYNERAKAIVVKWYSKNPDPKECQ